MDSRRRRPRPALGALAALVALTACTVDYDEVSGSAHLDYWQPRVSGHVLITKASQPGTGTTTSLRRDLGLHRDDTFGGGIDLDLGPQRIAFDYSDFALRGDAIARKSFVFHGQTYPAGDRVVSNLEVPTGKLEWSYAVWRRKKSSWHVGLGARLWTFDLKVADDAAGLNETRRFTHLYPLAASDLDWDFGNGLFVRGGGNLAALSLRREVFEALAATGFRTNRYCAEIGWRWQRFDFNESTNDGDFQLSGPFLAVHVRF
jgi:hypothetical protein